MTGEGIGQALATGTWAAEAIVAAGPDAPERAAARYQAMVRRAPGRRPPPGRPAQLGAGLAPPACDTVLATTALNDWTRRNFARWLFEDYPRAVLATPSRWHRRMLTGPGAWSDPA